MKRQYCYKGTYVHFSIIFITLKMSPTRIIPIGICYLKPFKFKYLHISKLDYII